MCSLTQDMSVYEVIAQVIQLYIDGAKSGRGEDRKRAFHENATIFGYVGAHLLGGPIQQQFTWNDEAACPPSELPARIASIEVVDTVATVRLELDNGTDYRFTEMFTLLTVGGEWKIMSKVSHLHSGGKWSEGECAETSCTSQSVERLSKVTPPTLDGLDAKAERQQSRHLLPRRHQASS